MGPRMGQWRAMRRYIVRWVDRLIGWRIDPRQAMERRMRRCASRWINGRAMDRWMNRWMEHLARDRQARFSSFPLNLMELLMHSIKYVTRYKDLQLKRLWLYNYFIACYYSTWKCKNLVDRINVKNCSHPSRRVLWYVWLLNKHYEESCPSVI